MSDINKKSFSISENKKSSFKIIPFGMKSSFNIFLNKKSNFNLAIYGFNLADKVVAQINSSLAVTFISHMTIKATTLISSKLSLIISQVKELLRGNTSVVGTLSLTFSTKEILKGVSSIVSSLSLSLLDKIGILGTSPINSSVDLTLTPELRKYYALADHDTKTLAEMDVMTLQELDYYLA